MNEDEDHKIVETYLGAFLEHAAKSSPNSAVAVNGRNAALMMVKAVRDDERKRCANDVTDVDKRKKKRAYKLLLNAYNLMAHMEYNLTGCVGGEQIAGFRRAMWLLDIPLKFSDLATQHGWARYVKKE